MRRRSFRKPAIQVALFPFLAVLVCTMGSLVVLLVIVVQQARAYVAGASPQPENQQAEDVRLAQERFQWRREVLEEQRRELTRKLADHRLQLSHLEDHIRRLQERWHQAQAAAAEIARRDATDGVDRHQEADDLERVEAELAETRARLERLRQEVTQRPRSFPSGGRSTSSAPSGESCSSPRVCC
jgi:hypothetical protein